MLDANVLVAGSIWPRFPGQVLNHAIRGDFILVLTDYVLEESRRHIARLCPDKLADFEGVLERINFPIVFAAINAKVDYFISQAKDITDPAQPVHEKLKIILPGTFLREHMGWTSEELEQVHDAKQTAPERSLSGAVCLVQDDGVS